MATRRITIRTTVRVQVRREIRWRATFTPVYRPAPALAATQTVPAATKRRVISAYTGGGGPDSFYIAPPSPDRQWDVFISYSGEDKATASELAKELEALDVSAWFAETELTIRMGLRRSIDYGLAHSRFCAVLMSHSFFQREWPHRELAAAGSASCRSGMGSRTTRHAEVPAQRLPTPSLPARRTRPSSRSPRRSRVSSAGG